MERSRIRSCCLALVSAFIVGAASGTYNDAGSPPSDVDTLVTEVVVEFTGVTLKPVHGDQVVYGFDGARSIKFIKLRRRFDQQPS